MKILRTMLAVVALVSTIHITAQERSSLTSFYDATKIDQKSEKSGWPVNGCKEFSVTITTGIGVDIETTINHCCVNGACAAVAFTNVIDAVFGSKQSLSTKQDFKRITIKESSTLLIGTHNVQIKPGQYSINSSGELDNLIYIGSPTKLKPY